MAKIDRIKEEIGWLKVTFALLVAIDVSLIGWLAQNAFDPNTLLLVIIAFCLIIICSAAIFMVNKKAFKKIQNLERP